MADADGPNAGGAGSMDWINFSLEIPGAAIPVPRLPEPIGGANDFGHRKRREDNGLRPEDLLLYGAIARLSVVAKEPPSQHVAPDQT